MIYGTLCGLLLGFLIGFAAAVCGQVRIEEQSIKVGFIKLCGDYYKIEKISKEI
jgi:hypothetical protein